MRIHHHVQMHQIDHSSVQRTRQMLVHHLCLIPHAQKQTFLNLRRLKLFHVPLHVLMIRNLLMNPREG